MTNFRPVIALLLFILIVIAPYWLYLPALFFALLRFPLFWEGVLLAFLADVLYGANVYNNFFLKFPFALAASILVLLVPMVHRYFRIHA